MAILILAYSRIGKELWGHRAIGENTQLQYDRIQSKRRVISKCHLCSIITYILAGKKFKVIL